MLKTIAQANEESCKEDTIPLMTYVCQSSDGRSVPLIVDGHNTSLRKKDCGTFVQKAVNYRLNETTLQIRYIREGLMAVIPLSILSMMTGEKLELLVCGTRTIDVEILKKIVRCVYQITLFCYCFLFLECDFLLYFLLEYIFFICIFDKARVL